MKYTLPLIAGLALANPLWNLGAAWAQPALELPSATLVKVMSGTGQALVHLPNQDTYVLVKRGDKLCGLVVGSIEKNRILLTVPNSPNLQLVMPVADGKLPLLNPYPESPSPAPAAARATVGAPAKQIPFVIAPKESRIALTASRPVAPRTLAKEATHKSARVVNKEPGPLIEIIVSRREFDRALGDFHARGKEIRVEKAAQGLRIVDLAAGSLFDRLGLSRGDLILSVAGRQIRNTDEAALVYVDLSTAAKFDVVVMRNKRRRTLRYRFTK